MNRRYRRKKRESKVKKIIYTHLEQNIKKYAIVSILFLIGIVVGVIFINNITENQSIEISNYINSICQNLKENQSINNTLLLKDSIRKNVILALFLWFMGSTVIGIPIVYLTICFRGFCLGYTISSIILTLGIRKRNCFFNFLVINTNFFICTLYSITCSKWNKTL